MLTQPIAGRLAAIALGHVTREYPHVWSHALEGPQDVVEPRALHPVFYGSLDWHSCVHSYWMLARLLLLFPDMQAAPAIRALFDRQLTPEGIAAERAYMLRPLAKTFERPYGWAWLLKLACALHALPDRGWSDILLPLATLLAGRFMEYLPKAIYPIRSGTHANTAFALALASDYANAVQDRDLADLLRRTAGAWYQDDTHCQAWEPCGDDFLSPALIEAECMRRLVDPVTFQHWLADFLPRLDHMEPATLFIPVTVSDRRDAKIAHLDGLNLSRAWCWRSLAASMPPDDSRLAVMQEAAAAHRNAALPHLTDDYMGEHWLASFALLALDQP